MLSRAQGKPGVRGGEVTKVGCIDGVEEEASLGGGGPVAESLVMAVEISRNHQSLICGGEVGQNWGVCVVKWVGVECGNVDGLLVWEGDRSQKGLVGIVWKGDVLDVEVGFKGNG